MPTREYGQYSLVSYVNLVRGERINVGVAIWHPRFGWRLPTSSDLKRIKCLDSDADVARVKRGLEDIRLTLKEWDRRDVSPLPILASRFQHGLVVSEPLNARVTDLDFLSDRLANSLIAPSRPQPKDNKEQVFDKQFRKGFANFARDALTGIGIFGVDRLFSERGGVAPISIAARFDYQNIRHVWRTMSFMRSDSLNAKRTKAKAMDCENSNLRELAIYKHARFGVAVRVYKDDPDTTDTGILRWIDHSADRLETFTGIPTIDSYEPSVLLMS